MFSTQGENMYQTSRSNAVAEWINQLLAGIPLPHDFHRGARAYFSSALNTARPGSCVVCHTPLIGRQADLCAGHWDYVLIPNDALESSNLLVEYLEFNLGLTQVETTSQHWQFVTKGHSRCEICNVPTENVEELRSERGHTLKRHIVCADHVSFRCCE